jgi:uncharacterized GH25 family protein
MLRRCLILVSAIIATCCTVTAHDMWIEPTSFRPDAGKIIGLRLRVGQDLLGDPIAYDRALIEQFVGIDAAGARKPVVGRDGADPAGLLRVAAAGLHIIGYKSNPSPLVLSQAKFDQYLKEEGLERIAELRARQKHTTSEVREVYARCAKSLLFSGAPQDAASDRAVGLTLELVALKNPYALRPGDDLPVSLTYEGRPLSGALVVAMNRTNPAAKIMARTDKNGRVNLKLTGTGMWMIKAVHMIPAPAGTNADWASFWASLTFEAGQ